MDPWDVQRDARLYAGPHPVVAHPPCQLWVNFAALNFKRYGGEHNRPGNDGGCFESALTSVRKWGGVLEHPASSNAWPAYGLLRPEHGVWLPMRGRLPNGNRGWVTEVWQSAYGHKARKRTWLYFAGTNQPPSLNWTRVPGTAQVGWFDRIKPTLSKREASATPPAFRDLLLDIARKAVDIQAVMKYNVAKPAVPEEHMAARKPSITRTRRTKKTPEPEATAPQDTGDGLSAADLVAEHLRVISNVHLTNIVTILNERLAEIVNALADQSQPKVDEGLSIGINTLTKKLNDLDTAVGKFANGATKLAERVEALEKTVDNLEKFTGKVEQAAPADGSEPAKRRGRPPKAPEAAPGSVVMTAGTHTTTPVEPAKPAPKTEVLICKHIGTLENLQRPGLARCTVCGAVVDVPVEQAPAPAAQQTVAVPAKANPAAETAAQITAANGKIPTADDVRAVAITFTGKHGKPALAEALKEFGATNLSALPEENRAGLMAKLQAGI